MGYVLLAVFIFLNLILAVVYNDYADFVKDKISAKNKNRVRGLRAAFDLLAVKASEDAEPQMSRENFEQLVSHTNVVEKVPTVDADEIEFFFSIMDDDHSGSISKAEFFDVVDILQYSFKKVRTTTWAERHRPDWTSHAYYEKTKEFVFSPAFGRATTAVLLVNVLMVFLESYLDLSDTLSPAGEEAFAVFEVFFSIARASRAERFFCPVGPRRFRPRTIRANRSRTIAAAAAVLSRSARGRSPRRPRRRRDSFAGLCSVRRRGCH